MRIKFSSRYNEETEKYTVNFVQLIQNIFWCDIPDRE